MPPRKVYKLSPELDPYHQTSTALSTLVNSWFSVGNYKVENESKFMQILENESHFSQNSDDFLFSLLYHSKNLKCIIPFIIKILSNPKLSCWLSSHFFYDSTPRFIAQLPPQVTSLGFIDPKYIKLVLHYFPQHISDIDAALFLFKDSLPSTANTRSGLIRHLCDIYIEASDAWNKIPMLNTHLFTNSSTPDTLPSILLQSPDEMLLKQLPTLLQHYETYAKDFNAYNTQCKSYQQVLDSWSSSSSWPDADPRSGYSCTCCGGRNYEGVKDAFSSAITSEKRERETLASTFKNRFDQAAVIARAHSYFSSPCEIKTEQQQANEKAFEAIINQHSIQMKSNTDEFNTKQSLLLEQIQELTKQLDQNYQNYVDNTKEVFTTIKTQVEAIGSSNTHPVFIPPTRPTIPTIISLYQGDKIEAPTKDPFGIGDFNAAGDIFGPTFDLASSGKHYDNFWPFYWGHDPMNVLKIYRNISTGLCELSSQFESKMVRLDENEKVKNEKRAQKAAAVQLKMELQKKKLVNSIKTALAGKKGSKNIFSSLNNQHQFHVSESDDENQESDIDDQHDDEDDTNINLITINQYELIHPQHYITWFDRFAMQLIVSSLIHQQKTSSNNTTTNESNNNNNNQNQHELQPEYQYFVDVDSIDTIINIIGDKSTEAEATFGARLLMLLRSHSLFPLLLRYLSSGSSDQLASFLNTIQEISPEIVQQISYNCYPFTLRFDELTPEMYNMLYDSYSSPLVSILQSSPDPAPIIQTIIHQTWDNNNQPSTSIDDCKDHTSDQNHDELLPFTNLNLKDEFITPFDIILQGSPISFTGTEFQILFLGPLYTYGTSNNRQLLDNPLSKPQISSSSHAVTLHLLIETLSYHNFFNLFNSTWLVNQHDDFNGISPFFWLTNVCSLFNFLYSYSGLSKNDGIDTLLSDSQLLMFHQCDRYENFVGFDVDDEVAVNHTRLWSKNTLYRPDRSRKLYGNKNSKPKTTVTTTTNNHIPIHIQNLFDSMHGEGEMWDNDWPGEGDFWFDEDVGIEEIDNGNDDSDQEEETDDDNEDIDNNIEEDEDEEDDYSAVFQLNPFKFPQDGNDLPYIHHLAANIVWLIENHRLDQESALDSKVFTSEQIARAAQLTTLLFFPSQIQIDQYFQDVLTFFQSQTNPQLQHKYKNVQDIKDFYRKLLLNSLPPTSSPPTQIPTTNTIETTPTTANDAETVSTTTPTTTSTTPDSKQTQDENPFCFTIAECHCLPCIEDSVGLPLPAKYLLHVFTDSSVNSLPDKSDYYCTRYLSEVIGNSTDIISELICAIRMLQILYPGESPF